MTIHYQTIDVGVASHNIPPPANEVTSLLLSSDIESKKGMHLLEFILSRSINSSYEILDSTWTKLSKNRTFTLLPSILLGATIWFGVTPDEELTLTAIHLLAVFSRYNKQTKSLNSVLIICLVAYLH